jgi:hypothetical protein
LKSNHWGVAIKVARYVLNSPKSNIARAPPDNREHLPFF